MVKIAYIDKASYLPDWGKQRLAEIGELTLFEDNPAPAEAAKRLREADVAIVEWTDITSETLEDPGRLRCIVLVTTGYAFVDTRAARAKGIAVCNTPQYSRYSVAEHAIGMCIALAKNLKNGDNLAREGHEYTHQTVGKELYQSKLGVLGMGSIGSWVAHLGQGFGMDVSGYSRSSFAVTGVRQASLEEVMRNSDFIVSCVSVNSSSQGLLSRSLLASTKRDCVFVNVAGNSILDEPAVVDLLNSGHFHGVGFEDVADKRLLATPRTLLSPGSAWYTRASMDRNVEMFVDTVKAFIASQPRFVVN
jgi:glycerate dehydrogenase